MAHINKSPAKFENFIIQSCTNTGVWLVEERDAQSGQPLAVYDFVNREYSAPLIGPDPVPMDNMADNQRQEFLALQKKLNKALLDEGKS